MVEKKIVWQNISNFQMMPRVTFLGRTHPLVVPLGTTSKNG